MIVISEINVLRSIDGIRTYLTYYLQLRTCYFIERTLEKYWDFPASRTSLRNTCKKNVIFLQVSHQQANRRIVLELEASGYNVNIDSQMYRTYARQSSLWDRITLQAELARDATARR